MATNLRLTNPGRAAIVDADNNGINAIRITKLALGAGSGDGGAADDGRTTLRDQRDIVAVTGAASVAGQLAVRAEFASANAYPATELGLFAQIGAGGAEFLLAYWTDDGAVFINKPANLRTIVAAAIVIQRSAADLAVNVAADVSVGTVGTLLDLADSPGSYVNAARRKVTVKADGTGVEFTVGLQPHEAADSAETRAGLLATKAVTPIGLKAVIDDLLAGAPGALDTLNELADALGDDPNFSATIMGLINQRLTQAEVDARIQALRGGVAGAADSKVANYSVVAADNGKTIEVDASGGARTVSLPDLAAGADGFTVTVLKVDASGSDVTIDGDAADTINGEATYVLKGQWEAAVLKWTGAAWVAIGGASTSWMRDFFGGASSREFATAGAHSYNWEWSTPTGLAIIIGGGGSSRLSVGGNNYTARGGGGGGGGGHAGNRNGAPGGFDGGDGAPAIQANTSSRGAAAGAGTMSNGGAGAIAAEANRNGGDGGIGQVLVVRLSGLSVGDTLTLTVGGGGEAGSSVGVPTTEATDGGDGRIILIPLF